MAPAVSRISTPEIVVAIRTDDEYARAADRARDELQREQRRWVGPVQVFEEKHKRRAPCCIVQRRRQVVEEAESIVLASCDEYRRRAQPAQDLLP